MSTRRNFLMTLAGCAAVGVCGGCRAASRDTPTAVDAGADARSAPSPGTDAKARASVGASAGNVADLAVGSLMVVSAIEACIARDDQGIYAMSLVCTHEGCDIALEGVVSVRGIVCHCHGSEFDANGAVLVGPATDPLTHLLVSVDALGNLTIHDDMVVDGSTRLAV